MTNHFTAGGFAKLDALVLGLDGQIKDLLDRVIESKAALTIEPIFSELHIHRGKQVVISDLIVSTVLDDGLGLEQIDEEALPYFVWENGSERVLLGAEDITQGEGPAEELVARICQIFAEARELDYCGPNHLLEEGTDEHKAEYAKRLYVAHTSRKDFAEHQAQGLRQQALALLKQAEAIDGRKPQAVCLNWASGESELYIEHESHDLSDETTLEQHMEDGYDLFGWRAASVFALNYEDLTG